MIVWSPVCSSGPHLRWSLVASLPTDAQVKVSPLGSAISTCGSSAGEAAASVMATTNSAAATAGIVYERVPARLTMVDDLVWPQATGVHSSSEVVLFVRRRWMR